MKELGVRAMTGAVYVALTLGAAWAGPFTTFMLYLPVCLVALREIHLLYWGEQETQPIVWTILSGAVVYMAVAMGQFEPDWTFGYAAAVGFLMLLIPITWSLIRGQRDPANSMGGALTSLLLVAVPFGLMVHFFHFVAWIFIGFIVLLWTNDTGA